MTQALPVAIVGAGPVGLAAAAHLVRRGMTPLVFERGASAAAAVRAWAHVRVFSPWSYNIDSAARDLLADTGWTPPDPDYLPTGAELLRDYLEPLAAHPEIAPHILCGAEVVTIAREGFAKITSGAREAAPFLIRWRDDNRNEHEVRVRAVIDASGTWHQPNPLGTDGLPVPGEKEAADRIVYNIPDVLGRDRSSFANRSVLVAGSGHSAMNVVLDLLRLQDEAPDTHVYWGLRHDRLERILGGGANDKLPGRGALGIAARRAVDEKRLTLLAPLAVRRVAREGEALSLSVRRDNTDETLSVDRVVVATGFRPDHSISRELRVVVDPVVEAPPALAPLIDPNLHSCGTVPPHGAAELAHPEPGFYIVGMKSYGRAPTFLMATGYEQVRSVVAEIAGDYEAARRVELVLPETGVCNAAPVTGEGSTCCGGPPPAERKEDACCAADVAAKDAGKSGCGCGSRPAALPNLVRAAVQQPDPERLAVPFSTHKPRILMLYGSLRERSYSRFLTFEAARLLERFGAEVEIFDPAGLPLPDATSAGHPKVQRLRELSLWSEGQVWTSPERHGAMSAILKAQIDWIPLSVGSVRPTQGRTLAVMQVSGGSQSFNAVNQMRVLGRWMRMLTIPNQSSVAKAFQEFDEDGRMKPSSYYDRVVDVMEELVKFTLLTRDAAPYLTSRYSERKEDAAKLEARVQLGSI